MRPEVESLGKIEGTRPVSLGRVQTRPKSQEKVDLVSGQDCGVGCLWFGS